jgi:uncharacterized protein (DUF952 family)
VGLIYHIAFASDWEQARGSGAYRISTRGRTLEQQGFIHAGQVHQVAPVANALFGDAEDLVVLVIDEDRVEAEIRYEHVPDSDEPFPHIYGALDADAVVRIASLRRDARGRYVFEPS